MLKLVSILFLFFFSTGTYAQNHWESIVLAAQTWKYLPATSEPPANWMMPVFSDDSWLSGPGGIGYDDVDDGTVISSVNSVYLRKTFEITDVSSIESALLDMDYDDAYVAYLNGIEIARSANLLDVGTITYDAFLTYDHEAQIYQGALPERNPVPVSLLSNGTNLLAIQVINVSITSSDLSSNAFLHAKIQGSDIIYNQTPDWFIAPTEFTESKLPIIKINTNGLDILDDPKIDAHMGIVNNGTGILNQVNGAFTDFDGIIGIEIRGQSSQMFPKKSYSFETRDVLGENLNVSLLGMPEENDWILYAPFSDKSMLRNVVTFELARKLGHYCSRTEFCELFINDVYQGVYVLMEKIKKDANRVDIATLNPDEITGDDLTGGYIFKVDKIDPDYVEGFHGFRSEPIPSYPNAMDIVYQYFYPDADEIVYEQKDYLKTFIIESEKTLIDVDFNNPNTGYNKYLNVGSFVDFLIMSELSKEVDKYRFSTYFHKQKESNGGEIFAGPIWDFNLGYANVDFWPFGLETSGWLYEQVESHDWSIMFYWKRLMEDPYFKKLVITRWKTLRQNEFSNASINSLIDSLTTLLDHAQERNYARWDILGTYVWPNYNWQGNTYQDEVNYFSNWLFGRIEWMDRNMNTQQLYPQVNLSLVNSTSGIFSFKLSLIEDYFNHSELKKKYFTINTNDVSAYLYEVIYNDAASVTIKVATSNPDQFFGSNLTVTIDSEILNSFEALTSNSIH
jgi:hypothetical protein